MTEFICMAEAIHTEKKPTRSACIVCQGKEFRFYQEDNGKSLKDFDKQNDMLRYPSLFFYIPLITT